MLVQKSRLYGDVSVSGAKNSALKLLTAAILTEEPIELLDFPSGLSDAKIHVEMLNVLGKITDVGGSYVSIREDSDHLSQFLNWDGRSIRNTLLILGALTTRFGSGRVPLPGGCKLGERKYDLHVQLLEQMGARVWEEDDKWLCAEVTGRLHGADIHLPIRSTGATENAVLCGTLARGVTTVWNPHVRPEVLDMIDLLRKMGAAIEVFGQKCIRIHGRDRLSGARHHVIPDNVEALTWAIGSVITGGEVEIRNFPAEHLEIPMIYLRESGMKIYGGNGAIIVRGGVPYPIDISTGPYPGINSDMQPLFAVYGAMSRGETKIVDLRFPGRYAYMAELAKMGVRYSVKGDLLAIHGGASLRGASVEALDLRAGIALVLAGLVADGETHIENSWQITRGYENIVEKLGRLEAKASFQ